jgi:hypothetical protein
MRRRRLGAAGEGRGWRRRATTARGVWLQCIFVERQVGRSPFGSKIWSTELTSRIPTQKSKDASRTPNPPFASYLRLRRGKPQKTQVGRKKKRKKKSPNNPLDGRNLRPYALNPLYSSPRRKKAFSESRRKVLADKKLRLGFMPPPLQNVGH